MTEEMEAIFKYKMLNETTLLQYGFARKGAEYEKSAVIMAGQFTMIVSVKSADEVNFKVIENESGEEYALVHVKSAASGFADGVKAACSQVLEDIAQKCFDTEIMKAEQTKRVLAFIKSKYNIQPEFLWEKHPDCAAVRRQDNGKWFAVIMSVEREKLGLGGDGELEIIDLKAAPDTVEKLVRRSEYYPAYHMNKKHWFTVCLDSSVEDDILFSLISQSYECAGQKIRKKLQNR